MPNMPYPEPNILPDLVFATTARKSGDLTYIAPWYGIVQHDQAISSVGPLAIGGIAYVRKTTGIGTDIAQGEALTYVAPTPPDTGGLVEVATAGDTIIAIALEDATTDAEKVLVRLLEYACCTVPS